ncbi:MAG: hypothetical protein LBD59_00775 [Prevotellaceae bacterium]|jgi:hypothetical protein|nr:hypothetical protein [Prevotellaceae bacterium]
MNGIQIMQMLAQQTERPLPKKNRGFVGDRKIMRKCLLSPEIMLKHTATHEFREILKTVYI